MKKSLFLAAFFLIIQKVICQQFLANQGGTHLKDYCAEIPYESIGGLIIIKAEIQGEEHNFIFDTGAITGISESLAHKLGLKTEHKILVNDSGDKKDSLCTTNINRISIGNIPFEQIPVVILPDCSFPFDCFNNAEGFIGSNLLRNSTINISANRRTIIITDSLNNIKPIPQNPQELIEEPFPFQSKPIITVYVLGEDTVSFQVLFDSGFMGLFDLSLHHYNLSRKDRIFECSDSTSGTISLGIWGNAKDTTLYKIVAPKLAINQIELSKVTVNTTAADNSRIGAKIFDYADVTIDYINRRFYLSPIKDNKIDCEVMEYPIQPTLNKGRLIVGTVWKPSKFPNVLSGDEIISIDSIECQKLSPCEQLFLSDYTDNQDSIKIVTKDKMGNKYSTWIKME